VVREGLEPTFYRVVEKEEDSLIVKKMLTEEFKVDPDVNVNLPWSYVGIKMYLSLSEEEEMIPKSSVTGKGCLIAGYLSEMNSAWLQSKQSF